MTKEQEVLIKLLSIALAGKKMGQIPCTVNWKTVMELANRHMDGFSKALSRKKVVI